MEAHETIGYKVEEKVRLRGAAPAVDASAQQVALLTDQEALAAATSDAERARLAEWDSGLLRGQIGLAQQDLARVRNDLTTALAQAHAQVADLGDRLKASVAAERKASARSNQQATSIADLSARLQLDSTMLTMSASVSPYASVSGQRRRSRLCCSRPRAGRLSRLRVCSVPARCMPHLATEASVAQQPQIEGH
jgi:hypothetical protein